MDNTMKTALAVGVGYMLGRKRKMRLVLQRHLVMCDGVAA